MTLAEACDYYAEMVQRKGWYAYARAEVHKHEEDECGLYRGIRFEVARRIKAVGFVVPMDERGEWWL